MYLEILKKFIILLNFITLDSILYSNYSLYTMDSPLFTANAHVIRIILIDSGSKGKCIKSREFRESFLFMYIHSRYWLVRACTSNLSHSTWSKSSVAELTWSQLLIYITRTVISTRRLISSIFDQISFPIFEFSCTFLHFISSSFFDLQESWKNAKYKNKKIEKNILLFYLSSFFSSIIFHW